MCVCMYVCMYACMHVCMYACMHVYTYVCVCMYVCMYVYNNYVCVCMYVFVFPATLQQSPQLGVPQRTVLVLAPLLFYVLLMIFLTWSPLKSDYMLMTFSIINSKEDCISLQNDINKFLEIGSSFSIMRNVNISV